MSKINVGNEPPLTVGQCTSAGDSEHGGILCDVPKHFSDLLRRHFMDILAHLGNDCLIPITLPAARAGYSIIGLRFSGPFESYMASCAKNIRSLNHEEPSGADIGSIATQNSSALEEMLAAGKFFVDASHDLVEG
jgi:hypothetical protein